MNSELDARWRNAVTPFNDDVLCLPDDSDLSLSQMRKALSRIVKELESRSKQAALEALIDWHEHDGYMESGTSTNWGEVRDWLESDDSLKAVCPKEDFVHRGLYPLSFEWYLRFLYDEADGEPPYCSFDLSGPGDLLTRLEQELTATLGISFHRQPAREYFDRLAAG
jgi:hypothetical protein